MTTETTPPVNTVKLNLDKMALFVAVVTGIAALAGAWVLLPYRVNLVEQRTSAVESKLDAQQQLLIRIDENVKALKEAQRRQ